MRHYAKKVAALGFLVFIGLWIVGAVRGLTLPYPPPPPMSISSASDRDAAYSSNSQYWNNLKQIGLIETPLPLVLDNPDVDKIRIHEKRATLTAGTAAFDADAALVHAAIKEHQASVFNEKNSGIEPGRRWTLEIGVHPDKFDSLVDNLRNIAVLSSVTVEQKDRTSEFRKLHAQRQSLKKYRESIVKLRDGKALTFDESLRLEQKIQDIDKDLSSLGPLFDDLLGKESFYHVHLSLVEYQPGDRRDHTYSTPQRVMHAFVWAAVWWFAVALTAGVLAATCVSVWILRQKGEPGA